MPSKAALSTEPHKIMINKYYYFFLSNMLLHLRYSLTFIILAQMILAMHAVINKIQEKVWRGSRYQHLGEGNSQQLAHCLSRAMSLCLLRSNQDYRCLRDRPKTMAPTRRLPAPASQSLEQMALFSTVGDNFILARKHMSLTSSYFFNLVSVLAPFLRQGLQKREMRDGGGEGGETGMCRAFFGQSSFAIRLSFC